MSFVFLDFFNRRVMQFRYMLFHPLSMKPRAVNRQEKIIHFALQRYHQLIPVSAIDYLTPLELLPLSIPNHMG